MELTVVAMIIGILTLLMVPNISQYIRNFKIRGVANEISSNLQKARNKAIMKNAQLGVTMVVEDERTYWIHLEDDQTPPKLLMVRQALDMALVPTPEQAVHSTRHQLPFTPGVPEGEGIRFALNAAECPTAPGGVFAPVADGVRFSRLGAFCQLGSTATCPDVTASGGTLDAVHATAGGGGLICVTDTRTGLSRWIAITTGGRISAQQ